jgi:hypothetical protein
MLGQAPVAHLAKALQPLDHPEHVLRLHQPDGLAESVRLAGQPSSLTVVVGPLVLTDWMPLSRPASAL